MEGIEKFRFNSPSTAVICGPTGCGKTQLMYKIIKNHEDMFTVKVDQIIWCYAIYQQEYSNFPNVLFHEGIYDVTKLDKNKHKVVILDDLMMKLDANIAQTFTVYSHHLNISVFFITQNLFFKNKFMRDVSLNTQYLFLFGQRRDANQISVLGTQMFPLQRKEFLEIYKEETSKKYGYLLADLHPQNTHRVLLRTNILPDQIETVYIPDL
jgi:Cdc6-like AAA superfamily ATPase